MQQIRIEIKLPFQMLCSGNQKAKTGNWQELKDAIEPGCDVLQTQGS